MISMKHNTKNGNEILRHVHYDQKEVMTRLDSIEDNVDIIANNVYKLLMYHRGFSKKHIYQFFPLTSRKNLKDFMDKLHPDYHIRMEEFQNLMLLTITDSIQKFADALMDNFFSREFAADIKWPTPGYLIFSIIVTLVYCHNTINN